MQRPPGQARRGADALPERAGRPADPLRQQREAEGSQRAGHPLPHHDQCYDQRECPPTPPPSWRAPPEARRLLHSGSPCDLILAEGAGRGPPSVGWKPESERRGYTEGVAQAQGTWSRQAIGLTRGSGQSWCWESPRWGSSLQSRGGAGGAGAEPGPGSLPTPRWGRWRLESTSGQDPR